MSNEQVKAACLEFFEYVVENKRKFGSMPLKMIYDDWPAKPQQPESEPIAYISKIALEELQKPECSEDMFGVTGTPSGRWDVGLFLDHPPTVRVPEGFKVVPCSDGEFQGFIIRGPSVGGVRANTSVWADEADPAHTLLHAMLSATPSIAEKDHE